ncbi:hypothetical protein JXA85_04630 [Candidatus Woesearchaeota archaeon]|nr:hypothetical protein [Candidatus Woesearchaeota archaeon]
MITRLLVALGTTIMLYSLILCVRIIGSIAYERIKNSWRFLFALECFFLLGYAVYLFELFSAQKKLIFGEFLVAAIFFFGAIFVMVVMKGSFDMIRDLNNKTEKQEELNKNLLEKKEQLETADAELEETKKQLERKNKELEETLEGFYLLKTHATDEAKTKKRKRS